MRENIIEEGYDPGQFCDYLREKKEGGDDINNWELMELIAEVKKFKNKIDFEQRKFIRTQHSAKSQRAKQ